MPQTSDAVRRQLDRILCSGTFRNAARLRAFLQFVVEQTLAGQHNRLKEYSIGLEVCGRSETFDPKLDPIVRVDASRLRSRLESYYQTEGASDELGIELPKGGYVPVFSQRGRVTPVADSEISLAVLPFVNLSNSSDHDYLGDGLTEELIHLLGRVKGLHVIARSSVFQFKGRAEDARGAGRRLGVAYIVEGSVRVAGTRLRVTAQLIHSTQGWLLWSEKYECEWQDVLTMQDEISASITDALKIQLAGQSGAVLFTHVTEDPEAYTEYLRGRHHWNQRTPEALRASVKAYEEALGRDPACAPAYAGLADTLTVMALNDQAPTGLLLPRAEAAARRALALRPHWPEALTSLAFIKSVFDWDWEGGARDFAEAIERQPGYSTAHYLYGIVNLLPRGRWADAIGAMRAAWRLDPVSPVLMRDLGLAHFMMRAWEEAEGYWRKAEALDPGYRGCLYWRARLLIETGQAGEAIAVLRARLAAGAANTRVFATIAYAHARRGERREAEAMLDELAGRARATRVPPLDFATIWLGLGQWEKALDCLEQAGRERAASLYQFGIDPLYEPVRWHPRGEALRMAMRLPQVTPR